MEYLLKNPNPKQGTFPVNNQATGGILTRAANDGNCCILEWMMRVPQHGKIESFSLADAVGRIRLEDGEVIRFGASALHDFIPAVGTAVLVEAVAPHPLGGHRATSVTLAEEDESAYRDRAREFEANAAQEVEASRLRSEEEQRQMEAAVQPGPMSETEAANLEAWKRQREEDERMRQQEAEQADILRREALLLLKNLSGPKAWSKLMLRAGVSRWNTRKLLRLARPAARMAAIPADEAVATASSKLGGAPDVAPGFQWPSFDGRLLAFLGQVCLSEIPRHVLDSLNLPADGLISFFYDADKQPWGFDPKNRGAAFISYLADAAAAVRHQPPAELPDEYRFRELRVQFAEETLMPGIESSEVTALELAQEQMDAYAGALDAHAGASESAAHFFGGHAQPIQGAMEEECALVTHGVYMGDQVDLSHPDVQPYLKEASAWRLLLQLDSDDLMEIMWGDSGRLYFWVKEDDLSALRFEGAWTILQCY